MTAIPDLAPDTCLSAVGQIQRLIPVDGKFGGKSPVGWLADVALLAQLGHNDAMHDYRDRFREERLGKLVKHKPMPEKPKP